MWVAAFAGWLCYLLVLSWSNHAARAAVPWLLGAAALRLLVLAVVATFIRWCWPRGGPWWADTRLRILALLGLIVGALGALDIIDAPQGEDDFDRHFIEHLREAPEYSPVLIHYPLRNLLYRQTRAAFIQGGWPAATTVFRSIIRSQVAVYGDDAHILAYWRAFLAVPQRLQPNPTACANYVQQPAALYAYPQAVAEIARLRNAWEALVRDGATRLEAKNPPPWLDPDKAEWDAVWQTSLRGPERVTPAEDAAILNAGDPAADCRGGIKWVRNTLALDPARAAHAFRIIMIMGRPEGRNNAYRSASIGPPRMIGGGFACPARGTRFVLDIKNPDGSAITQTVIGRRGIDCRLYSTSRGTYGAIAGMVVNQGDKATADAMARLWPLEIGKSANTVDTSVGRSQAVRTIFSVVGVGNYRVGEDLVTGYQIDVAVYDSAIDQRYILHFVWSPELKWTIQSWTEYISGPYPSENAADWDLVRVVSPGPP